MKKKAWSSVLQKILPITLALVLVFDVGLLVGRKVERNKIEEEKVHVEGIEDDLLADGNQPETPKEMLPTDKDANVSSNEVTTKPETEGQKPEDVPKDEPVIEEPVEEGSVSSNQIWYRPKWKENYQDDIENLTLEARQANKSSFEETLGYNQKDKEIIAANSMDFSHMKIACLGDSITQGVAGATPYPEFLKEMLGAYEVYNFGIGGSTIASGNGANPMSLRCEEIPPDVDLIVVMGGVNDSFYQAHWQFGFMDWSTKGAGTFCGDLQLLMRRLKWLFPNTKVIFFTPMSTSKFDEMKVNNPNLLEQAKFSEAIRYIGSEEGIDVVDLYNQNFLNSHDSQIMEHYMRDSVHMNVDGNRVLAERVASEILKRYEP